MRHLLRQRVHKVVIVTLRSGRGFRGVLFDADPDLLVLRNAEVVEPGASSPVGVDGEVLIPRCEIEFVQRP